MKALYSFFLLLLTSIGWSQLSDFQKLVVEDRIYERYDVSQPYPIPYYWIKEDNKWGVISSKNELILPVIYDDIGVILEKDACLAFKVKKNGLYGLYDCDGMKILSLKCQYIVADYYEDSDLIFYAENYKIGVLSLSNGLLFPAKYKDIYCAADRFYIKTAEGEKQIYDRNSRRLLAEYSIKTIGHNRFFENYYFYRPREYWVDWEKKEFYLVEKDGLYGVFNADLELVIPVELSKDEIRVRNDTIELREGKKWIPYFCEPSKVRTEAEFAESRNTSFISQDFSKDSLLVDLHTKGIDAHIRVDFYIDSHHYTPGLNAYSIRHGNLNGIVGYDGKVIIPVIYERIKQFRAGRAIVVQDGKYGLINKAGLMVVPTKYDWIEELKLGFLPSSNDYYLVNLNGKYGCIDRNGNEIIPMRYDKFNLNIGILEQQYVNIHGYKDYNYPLDEFGTEPINGGFEHYNFILEGLDKDSNAHYPFGNNGSLTDFFPVKSNGKWGLISIENELKIPVEYDTLYFLSHNLVFAKKNKKKGVLTVDNEVFIPFNCDTIFPLKGTSYNNYLYLNPLQLLVYQIGGKVGLFDPVSQKKLPPKYDEIETSWGVLEDGVKSFFLSEGWPAYNGFPNDMNTNTHDNWQYLRYRIGDQYGLINTFTVEDLTPNLYSKINLFQSTQKDQYQYLVQLEDKMSFFLPIGGELFKGVFDSVKVINPYSRNSYFSSYFRDRQRVELLFFATYNNRKCGLYNSEGFPLLAPIYDEIAEVNRGVLNRKYEFVVRLNAKYGVIDQNGSVLIPFKYDSITLFDIHNCSNRYKLTKKDKITYKPEFDYPKSIQKP